MIKVRLSYQYYDNEDCFMDSGIIDLVTKDTYSCNPKIDDDCVSEWLELTDSNLVKVCEFCSTLGIEANGLKEGRTYWISDDQCYRLDIRSDMGEDIVNKIFEIELALWKVKLSQEVNNLERLTKRIRSILK